METKFRGTDYVPSLAKTTVHCHVRFQGSNVLEGIQSLREHGLISQPLPSYLTKIHSLSKNRFILTDKKKTKAVWRLEVVQYKQNIESSSNKT